MENTEIWKGLPNYENLYEISSFGNVRSLDRVFKMPKGIRRAKGKDKTFFLGSSGYYAVDLLLDDKRKNIKVHQLVAMTFLNHIPCGLSIVVDHIDENRLNNNASNLRLTTSRFNSSRAYKNTSSKYTGVHFYRGKWVSRIYYNGKRKNLGSFDNEYDAHLAYQKELIKL